MSCAVPTGPFIPRSGYASINSSSLSTAKSNSSAKVAMRLPRVVIWAATLCERPAIASSEYATASRLNRSSAAIDLSRITIRLRRICNCSTFSVKSREVMPRWRCSAPAKSLNSSMRALTSCLETRSRSAIDSRLTVSTTASYFSGTPFGIEIPNSCWARMTAIHSCRSSRIFASCAQISRIGSDA